MVELQVLIPNKVSDPTPPIQMYDYRTGLAIFTMSQTCITWISQKWRQSEFSYDESYFTQEEVADRLAALQRRQEHKQRRMPVGVQKRIVAPLSAEGTAA